MYNMTNGLNQTRVMIIKSEFKADLFELKHCAAPEVLLNELKDRAAIDMGRELIKQFPYQKDEENSFKGQLPAMSLNRDHEFVDKYKSEFVVLTMEEYAELLNKKTN